MKGGDVFEREPFGFKCPSACPSWPNRAARRRWSAVPLGLFMKKRHTHRTEPLSAFSWPDGRKSLPLTAHTLPPSAWLHRRERQFRSQRWSPCAWQVNKFPKERVTLHAPVQAIRAEAEGLSALVSLTPEERRRTLRLQHRLRI